MRLKDIREGGFYAVTVDQKQWQLGTDLEDPLRALQVAPIRYRVRHRLGRAYRVRVVQVGVPKGRRKGVAVELTYRVDRREHRIEDNLDGTLTEWTGRVYRGDPNDEDTWEEVQDERTVIAVVEPSQVLGEWDEVFIQHQVQRLDWELESETWKRRRADGREE
ncbi:MAG: hypothetical protein ABR529_07795 [Actinomycetota bacterium]